MKNLVYFFAGLLVCSPSVHANCGLDHCPRLSQGEKPSSQSASLQIRTVAFDLDSGSGHYQELLARYEYTGIQGWVLGGNLPIIALTVHSETHYGVSNPLLYASWYKHVNETGMFYAGLQLELPFGNAHEGMGTDHFMLVPYVLAEQSFGAVYALAGLGYSQAFVLHEHEAGEEHPLFVNPHEDQELLYRVGAGFHPWTDRVTPQFSVSGSHAVVEDLEGAGRDHLTGSIAVVCDLGHNLTLSPSFDLPLNSPKRFNWSAGLEIKSLF